MVSTLGIKTGKTKADELYSPLNSPTMDVLEYGSVTTEIEPFYAESPSVMSPTSPPPPENKKKGYIPEEYTQRGQKQKKDWKDLIRKKILLIFCPRITPRRVESVHILKEISTARVFRCLSCCQFAQLFILALVLFFGVIYTMFFRAPYFYVEMTQIIKKPTITDSRVGIRVIIRGMNPNLGACKINQVFLFLTLVDVDSGDHYRFVTPITEEGINQNYIEGRSYNSLSIEQRVKSEPSDFEDVYNYLLSGKYGLLIKGRITYSVGTIKHVISVENYHQLRDFKSSPRYGSLSDG